MKYNRFEELPVWQDAIELAIRVYDFTARQQFKGYYSLKDQLERATVSISNNVAEGFERGTTQELITFLYISRGSAGETRSVLCLCDRLKRFVDLKSEISDLKERSTSISRQLRLVRLPTKQRHSRSAVFDRKNQASRRKKARPRSVLQRTPRDA